MAKVWDVPHLATGADKPDLDPDTVYVYNMRFCPYAQRAILSLLAKKVPFKVININLKAKPDWFVESTFGKVPVILYKGEIIPESLITSDYVDEMFPGPKLHPEDPTQKAKDRVFLEIYNRMIMAYYKCAFAKDEEARETTVKDLIETIKPIEKEIEKRGTKFFCGENPGMLDLMMWPWLERLPLLENRGITLPEFKTLKVYIGNMWQTDAVKEYGLSTEDHYKFTKQYVDKLETIDYDFLIPK